MSDHDRLCRCWTDTAALGHPYGVGSPKNDAVCRALLGLDARETHENGPLPAEQASTRPGGHREDSEPPQRRTDDPERKPS